jgi:hypothetical protein
MERARREPRPDRDLPERVVGRRAAHRRRRARVRVGPQGLLRGLRAGMDAAPCSTAWRPSPNSTGLWAR